MCDSRYGPGMAIRKTFTVSVTPEQHDFIHNRLKLGRFSSVNEVVRAGLRLLEQREPNMSAKQTNPVDDTQVDAR